MRPTKDIECWREELCRRFRNGDTITQLIVWLRDNCEQVMSESTLKRRLKEWDCTKKQPMVTVTGLLEARVTALFYQCIRTDEEITFILKSEGFDINKRKLGELRRSWGIRMRNGGSKNPQSEEDEYKRVFELLKQELEANTFDRYGKGLLHLAIHQRGHIASR
jgi:hypothetical protein